MEFLKNVLGDDLFSKVKESIEKYNEDNKDSAIKLADLSKGDYVGKGKYDSLQSIIDSKDSELKNANELIESLKSSEKNNEDIQTKITEYESTINALNEQLKQQKLDNAVNMALADSKAIDVDYIKYKLKEQGEISLDEQGNIVGWQDTLKELKTKYPSQFKGEDSSKVELNKLDNPKNQDKGEIITKERFDKMTYAEKNELYHSDLETYEKLANS